MPMYPLIAMVTTTPRVKTAARMVRTVRGLTIGFGQDINIIVNEYRQTIWSGDGKVVAEEEMDGRDVPVGVHYVQFIEFWVLVGDSILFQGLRHVQRSAQSFPDIAGSVFVILQVAVEDFFDGFFGRYFQNCTVIVDHIDDADASGLFGEFSDDVLGIFPPFDLAVRVDMQVFASGAVVLTGGGLEVYSHAGFSAGCIEPEGDICACRLYEGCCKWIGDVFLNHAGEVVDLPKQNNPAIIGRIVIGNLLEGIVSLFRMRDREELLQRFLRMRHQVIQLGSHSHLEQKNRMKINSSSKFVPNLLTSPSPEEDYCTHTHTQSSPFREITNSDAKNGRKQLRKHRQPKAFLCDQREEDTQDVWLSERTKVLEETTEEVNSQMYPGGLTISQRPNILLTFDVQDQSSSSECQEEPSPRQQESVSQEISLQSRDMKKFNVEDWDNSSENDGDQSLKIIEEEKTVPPCPSKPQTPKQEQFLITKDTIFQKVDHKIQCLIRRDKKNFNGIPEYNVYFQGSLKHIMTVRKEGMWHYCFYLRESCPGQMHTYIKIATMESSFLGNKFTLLKYREKYSQMTVQYETNLLGLSGPRKMHIYLPKTVIPVEYLQDCYNDMQWRGKIDKCVSRTAKWNQKVKSYVLNLHGRANESSIKNFVITDVEESEENSYLVFGKAGQDVYNLDVMAPFGIIQGVAVAVTSFQRKLTCD